MPYTALIMENHIEAILFDLDKTLYDPAAGLQEAGDRLITQWIAQRLDIPHDEADAIRIRTWREYGTTTAGMIAEFGISGREFCDGTVNRLDPGDFLAPWPELAQMLSDLRARCHVFTNAPADYARRVLDALAVSQYFERIFDIEYCGWSCKPQARLYESVLADLDLPAEAVAVVDDDALNLAPAKQLGMVTVLCGDRAGSGDYDLRIDGILDLTGALRRAGLNV